MITRNINNVTKICVPIFGTHFQLCAHLHMCIAHCYSNKQKHKLVAYSYLNFSSSTGKQGTNEYASDKPINYLI